MESQRKRKKVKRKVNLIDDLPETILLHEIFSTIHNPRDIIVCKSVSKSWNSILSSSSLHHKHSLSLILNAHPLRFAVTKDTWLQGWKGFQLNNYLDLEFKSSQVCVLASYRDVLLCVKSSQFNIISQFYLVNPVTMRWTRVPKTSKRPDLNYPIGLSGDVSEKNRFYVVEMRTFLASRIILSVFDSKLGKWRARHVKHPFLSRSGLRPTQFQALNFDGVLHWLDYDGPIIAYNPEFEHRRKCRFIHRSKPMHHASYGELALVSETLTISMNHLRIIQVICYPRRNNHLVIWTLVDYKKSKWKQENDQPIYFRDMISDLPWIQNYMRGYTLSTADSSHMSWLMISFKSQIDREPTKRRMISPQPLHCHPNNPLLLYLYLREGIVSLDVVTKKLCLITRFSQSDKSSRYWNRYDIVTPITLRLDPTLVPDHERVILPHASSSLTGLANVSNMSVTTNLNIFSDSKNSVWLFRMAETKGNSTKGTGGASKWKNNGLKSTQYFLIAIKETNPMKSGAVVVFFPATCEMSLLGGLLCLLVIY